MSRLLAAIALLLAARVAAAGLVICPIDGKTFRYDEQPGEPIRGRNLDMKPIASYPTPWPLPQCPGNGFPVFRGAFSVDEVAKLQAFVDSPRYRDLLAAETPYYVSAVLRRELGEPQYDIAWALTQATWETADKPDRYRRYAQEALAAFDALPRDLDRRQNTVREMISGELERRLGLFDAAEKRFRRLRDAAEFTTPQLQHVITLQLRLVDKKDTSTQVMPR